MSRLLATAAIAAAMLIAGSCSSGDDAAPQPTSRPATTSPATTATPLPATTVAAQTTTPPATRPPATTSPPAAEGLFRPSEDGPVVSASDGVRDARFVAPGAVLHTDGLFHMLSGGFSRWPGPSTVAYYTSLDGRRWTAAAGQPVFTSEEIPAARPGTMGHAAVKDTLGRWVVYFHTTPDDGSPGDIGRVTAPSPLGPWSPEPDPAIAPGPGGSWDAAGVSRPQVVDTSTGLVMFFSGVDADGVSRIGMASSDDGSVWTKHDGPVFEAAADWEGGSVGRPGIALTPDGFVMVYEAQGSLGLAFSDDGTNWSRVEGPVVTTAHLPSGVTRLYQPALVYDDGTYFLYLEAGTEQGADVHLLTHDGLLRDPTTIAGPRVETVVASLDISTGGVTMDADGNVYVADFGTGPGSGGTALYRITPGGELSVFADHELLIGASGNTVAADGTIYQSSFSGGRIMKIDPEGDVTLFADEGINGPVGIVANDDGSIFVADCSTQRIAHVDADGTASTFAVSPLLRCPNGLTTDGDGTLYVANFSDGGVLAVSPEGVVSRVAVVPGDNNGHLAYFEGALYVVARGVHRIYKVTLDGAITPIAGTGERGLQDGFAIRATMALPNGIAIAPDGTIWINHVASLAGSASNPTAVRVIRPGRPR